MLNGRPGILNLILLKLLYYPKLNISTGLAPKALLIIGTYTMTRNKMVSVRTP
jgi:hypothetical protein